MSSGNNQNDEVEEQVEVPEEQVETPEESKEEHKEDEDQKEEDHKEEPEEAKESNSEEVEAVHDHQGHEEEINTELQAESKEEVAETVADKKESSDNTKNINQSMEHPVDHNEEHNETIIKEPEVEPEQVYTGPKQIHEYKCSMNKLKSAHLSEYIEVYECRKCKKDNICKDCFLECHKHDEENWKKESKAQLLREVFDCYCHSKKHQLELMEESEVDETKAQEKFDLSSFLRRTRIASDVDAGVKVHQIFESIVRDMTYIHPLVKSGESQEKEERNIYDIASLFYVFFSEDKSDLTAEPSTTHLNLLTQGNQGQSNLVKSSHNNCSLLNSFYKPMIIAHDQLQVLFDGRSEKMEARVALEKISQEYDDYCKTFEVIKKHFPISPALSKNRVMLKIYSIEFILSLFKSEIKKQDYLYRFKVQTLRTFIDIYIKPVTQLKYKKALTAGFYNTTPLHRYIFREKGENFFSAIGMTENKYLELIDAVFVTLEKALEEEELVDASEIFKQYYRLIKYMLSYKITDFNKIIVKLITQIIKVKEECTKIKDLLPELIKLIFIEINDHVFHCYYLKRDSGPREDIIDGSFIFENTDDSEASQLYLKLVKLLFSINFTTEEEIEFPMEIFDMLLINKDDYIESLQSVLHCRKNYISEKIHWILDPNWVEEKTQEKKDNHVVLEREEENIFQNVDEKKYFLQEDLEEKNKDSVNLVTQHEKLFESLSDCNKTLYEHLKSIETHLDDLEENHLQKSLNLCGSTNKNLKQLWMFKNGLFTYLNKINHFVYRSSHTLPEDCGEDYKVLLQKICESILRIFGKMVEDNSFLCAILFNEKALKTHFIPKFVETDEVGKFRFKLLTTLKEDDYRINFTPFLDLCKPKKLTKEERERIEKNLQYKNIQEQHNRQQLRERGELSISISQEIPLLEGNKNVCDVPEKKNAYYNLEIMSPELSLIEIKAKAEKLDEDFEELHNNYGEISEEDINHIKDKQKRVQSDISLMERNNTTMSIYEYLLKLASENSKDRVNHFVMDQILKRKELIHDSLKYFVEMLKLRKQPSFDDSLNKEESLDEGRVSNAKKLNLTINEFVLNFLKLVNNLNPCYIYIINNELSFIKTPLEEIMKNSGENTNTDTNNNNLINIDSPNVQNKFNFLKLKPEELITFVKFYTNYFIKYPYQLVDLNSTSTNEKKCDWSSEFLYDQEFPLFADTIKDINYDKCKFDNKENALYEIIKNFPKYYNFYKSDSFDKNPRFLLKFFLEVIVKPICQILYKTAYFSGPDFSNDTKYSIYVAVCLFFKSYKKILETIIGCGYIREEYYNLYKTFFIVSDTPDKDMDIFFLRVISDLERQIVKFDQDKMDFLNTEALLDIFSKLLQKFQFRIKQFKNFRDDKENFNNFFKVVSSFANTYLRLKKKPEINLVRKLIVENMFEDIDNKEDIKQNLLLFPLYYYSKWETPTSDLDPKKCREEAFNQILRNPRKSYYLKLINKVMKNDPSYYQKCLIQLNKDYDGKPLAWERIKFIPTAVSLSQFIFAEFSSMFHNSNTPFIKLFKRLIKFLSILCNRGNDFFIQFIARYPTTKFIFGYHYYSKHLLLCLGYIIKNITHYDKVKDLVFKITTEQKRKAVDKDNFFYKIYKTLFNLHKQMVQSPERVLEKDQEYNFKILQNQVEQFILDNIKHHLEKNNKKIINFLLHFLDLLNLYVFDGKPKNYNEINPNLILKLFVSLYEHIYRKYLPSVDKVKDEDYYDSEHLIKYMEKNLDIYHDETFKAYCKLFMYFARLCQFDKKYKRLYDTMMFNVKEGANNKLSTNQRTLGEILKLFGQALRSVEILVKHEEAANQTDEENYSKFTSFDSSSYSPGSKDQLAMPKLMWFEVHPDGVYIVPNDNEDFFNFTIKEASTNKMQFFLNYYSYIKTIIKVRKEGHKNAQSHFSNAINKMTYEKVETYSIFFATITNILIVFSMYYSDNTVMNPLGPYVVTSAIIHLLFLFTCLSNLIWSEVSKYNQLKDLQKANNVTFMDYASSYISSSLYILIWNFLIGLIATLSPSLYFLYSLQMFAIFAKFETMQNVLVAIKLKYMQFVSTGVLILILVMFYSIISVFFFQNQFMNPDLNENSCSSLLHCFLSFIINGIRTGSGFGFPVKAYGDTGYWSEFIFDWAFYFTIMLILINIINGVIVDTFQSLRTENEALIETKENYCFICSLKRSRYEAKGVDFNDHKQNEHNVMDYYQLFYKLEHMREDEMNYIEQYVFRKKNQNLTDFLPTKTHFRFTKTKK